MRAVLFTLLVSAALPQSTADRELLFHHLHLRDARPESRIGFYERMFAPGGVQRISFGDAQGLLTGSRRILISIATPGEKRPAALWHFGWGDVSLGETYLAHARREVAWEPPLPADALHLHLRSTSPAAAAAWYRDVLGADAILADALASSHRSREDLPPPEHRLPGALVILGGLPMLIYPSDRPLASSLESGIDHVAFSCRDLDALLTRLRGRSVRVLRDPDRVGTVRTAMIHGPDLVAIELLELPP